MSALKSCEEAAQELGHISAATIRRLAKQRHIEYVAGPRGKVLLTEEQVAGVLAYLTKPVQVKLAVVAEAGGVDAFTSSRSRARAGHR